jgi:hypothetical protein
MSEESPLRIVLRNFAMNTEMYIPFEEIPTKAKFPAKKGSLMQCVCHKVPGSNLGPKTGNPDFIIFMVFHSSP